MRILCPSYLWACVVAFLPVLCTQAHANDWAGAPPSFSRDGESVVPIDISSIDIDYHFNYSAKKATARARLVFVSKQDGLPMFDLVPEATALTLNGISLSPDDLLTVESPARATEVRVLKQHVVANSENVLDLEYALSSGDVTFENDAVRVGFFMFDTLAGGRHLFEQYGPANFEFDQIKWRMTVTVSGTQTAHEIFTNGNVTPLGSNQWVIEFPEYFTSSSPYFHLAEKNRFEIESFAYSGQNTQIPVTIYAESQSVVSDAAARTRLIMSELENTYGPFAHDKLVIYVTPSGGGMEYCGATMTSMRALGHELTHSWFARGVMPANGNAGWIDEAVASWRDNGYPRAATRPDRAAVNLGGLSPYSRHTPREAYTLGAQLMSEFDFMARDRGGLRQILKKLFAEKQRKTVTVDFFKKHMEEALEEDLTDVFNRYVYGKSFANNFSGLRVGGPVAGAISHPRQYTAEELRRYR